MSDTFDRIMDWVIIPFFCLSLIALLVSFLIAMNSELKAERFSLRKDEWHCTAQSTIQQQQMIGKIWTTVERKVCDQWSRMKPAI